MREKENILRENEFVYSQGERYEIQAKIRSSYIDDRNVLRMDKKNPEFCKIITCFGILVLESAIFS